MYTFYQCCGDGPFLIGSGFFSPALAPAPDQAPIKSRLSTTRIYFFNNIPPSLLEKIYLFLSICSLNSLLSMWEWTKRISFKISSVSSNMEPEPDLHNGSSSNQKNPPPLRLRNTAFYKGTVDTCKKGLLLVYKFFNKGEIDLK